MGKSYINRKNRLLRLGLLLTIVVVGLSLSTFLVGANMQEESNCVSMEFFPEERIVTSWYSQEGFSPDPFVPTTYGPFDVELIRGPSHNSPVVFIVVNSTLWNSGGPDYEIQDRIDRYHDDVEALGYSVSTWILNSGNPEGIRSWLADEFASPTTDLVGCVLIGNIPSAWYQMYHVPPWSKKEYEEFPIDLFYTDLDGDWDDTLIPPAPGIPGTDGIYDVHVDGSGDVEPDIWLGRIKADDMTEPEVDLVVNYFDKNHNYRTGSLFLPQRALVYVDDDWYPSNDVFNAVKKAYPDTTHITDHNTTRREDYLTRLRNQWSWVHLMCHGNPGGHGFKIKNETGDSVGEGVSVSSGDYRAGNYPVFFYNLFVCSGARYTSANYLAGWCIFAPDYGLAAIGSTKTGSMGWEDDFYTPLSNGNTLGDAFEEWFVKTAEKSRPWYYGMTLIGDPTLRVSGKHTVTINTPGLASETGIVHYTKDGSPKTGDISGGTWSDQCDHGTTLSIDFSIPISGTERYYSCDTTSWKVAEPITHTVTYHHQYKPTVSTVGLPATAKATVSFEICGASASNPTIWDGNAFNQWCDDGSTVSITNPVIVPPGDERYYSLDQDTWTVSSAFTATVHYDHQFLITCSVTTAGVGHEDLTASNHVTVSWTASGSAQSFNIYDGLGFSAWMDAGTTFSFENPSSGSTSTHRWFTPSPTSYVVVSSATISLTYYEQFFMTISSSGGLLTSTFYGTTQYVQFGGSETGSYWDYLVDTPWDDWCDIGSTLSASQIVLGPPNERYHTPGTVSWTVTGSASYTLPYHKEYKITVTAEGLLDTSSTTVTIGTANPSPSDDVAGGDATNYVVTLNLSNMFTWTNWVHADTPMTAMELITISPSEKYILVFWTRNGDRYAPPTINAEVPGLTYAAQYAGVKKEMSLTEANLTDSIIVTIEISNPPAGTSGDTVTIVDDLPNELSYVMGSAEIDGIPYTPPVDIVLTPIIHQRLTFTVDGSGKHTITFEVKVNRAYGTDQTIENEVSVTFAYDEVPPVDLDVIFPVIIHPYIGPSLSKTTDGPEIVPLFTEESWVFTYIVKNNYDYLMTDPVLKDNFGAELIYDEDTILANLLTDPIFSTASGSSEQVRVEWILPDITIGEAFMLQVTISTGTNPAHHQEYTSPGVKILNSGATLKWRDDRFKQQSLTTETISVLAVGQINGQVKDQYGEGVEKVIVELYYDDELIQTAQTDATGHYHFVEQLTASGLYTVKIVKLPKRYDFGMNPSQKTAMYTVGQLDPTEVNFDVEKVKGK